VFIRLFIFPMKRAPFPLHDEFARRNEDEEIAHLVLLVIEMREHVRSFLDPVARFRLRCISRMFYEEDVHFTLPDGLRTWYETFRVPVDAAIRAWGLAWMHMFDTPIFHWIAPRVQGAECEPTFRTECEFPIPDEPGVCRTSCDGVMLDAEAPCPRGSDAKHSWHIFYEMEKARPWAFRFDHCKKCRSQRLKFDFVFVCAPTLEEIWQTNGTFLLNAATADQGDDTWLTRGKELQVRCCYITIN
jgi:hypothetical protein